MMAVWTAEERLFVHGFRPRVKDRRARHLLHPHGNKAPAHWQKACANFVLDGINQNILRGRDVIAGRHIKVGCDLEELAHRFER